MKAFIAVAATFLTVAAGASTPPEQSAPPAAAEATIPLAEVLDSDFRPPVLRLIDERRLVWNGVQAIYEARDMQALWTGSAAARRRAEALIERLSDAAAHGLVPQEYDAHRFAAAFEDLDFKDLDPAESNGVAKLDVSLTTALLAYAHDMWDGRLEPGDVRSEHEVYLQRTPIDAVDLVRRIEDEGIKRSLDALEPQHDAYKALTRTMRETLAAKSRGGYTRVAATVLKKGDGGEPVRNLIRRLREGGYLVAPLPASDDAASDDALYTADVESAVRQVQRESALKVDGVFGPNTAAILNQTIDDGIRRLAINLDRWRWLPRDLGEDYLWVNIPDYTLRIYEDGTERWSTRIIAGTSVHRTPIFADRLEYIVFSPSWIVPNSIIGNELIPLFREDPYRVDEKNMEITDADGQVLDPLAIDWSDIGAYDIGVRQKPGPQNALGRVKFIFPNRYAIYLHDTPADHLFDNSKRSFSHGCIRVAEPERLAEYLLRDASGWSESAVVDAMHAEEDQKVYLEEPVPVYITYFTAIADTGGEMRYLADVYGHDQVVTEALASETPRIGHGSFRELVAR